MSQRIRVFAPASASNLGPGFDVLGLALERPGDVVEVERREAAGVEIVEGHQNLRDTHYSLPLWKCGQTRDPIR